MEKIIMKLRALALSAIGLVVMMMVLAQAGFAGGTEDFQKYFSDTASKVKATDVPEQKREIINNSLQTMSKALDKVQNMPLVSKDDRASIDRLKDDLRQKQDELAGNNGYERVPDSQLNAFSDYVVQDMEQAEKTITIGLVAALLIVIIIILVV